MQEVARDFEVLIVRKDGGVLFVEIAAPPMNLIGPNWSETWSPSFSEPRATKLAERCGWINRALPAHALDDFVSSLAHRTTQFANASLVALKQRVNAIALAPVEDIRRSVWQRRDAKPIPGRAFKGGFQTRDGEMDLGRLLGELSHH